MSHEVVAGVATELTGLLRIIADSLPKTSGTIYAPLRLNLPGDADDGKFWDTAGPGWAAVGAATHTIATYVDIDIWKVAVPTGATTGKAGGVIELSTLVDNLTEANVLTMPGSLSSVRVVSTVLGAIVTAMEADTLTASATATDAVNEIRDGILSDSTPFAGANIDAAVTSRQSEASALSRATADIAEHDATQVDIAALNDPTAGAVADAVLDELIAGHTIDGSLADTITDIATATTNNGSKAITISFEDALAAPALSVIADVYDASDTTFIFRISDDDLDGDVVLNLDPGTYSIRSKRIGWTPDNSTETLVVTVDAAVTYSGTVLSEPGIAAAGQVTVYGYATSGIGTRQDGRVISFIPNVPAGVSSDQLVEDTISVTSGPTGGAGWATGYYELDLMQGTEYLVRSSVFGLDDLVITTPSSGGSVTLVSLTEAAQ